MARSKSIALEAACGCEIDVPVVIETEQAPGPGYAVRIRLYPADGGSWLELEEMLLTVCDACIEP